MITYKENHPISPEQLADVFSQSTIKRPHTDLTRLKKMIESSPLLITAWDDEKIVGVARSLTDFSYCSYLSDLAVIKDYQRQGIGEELISLTKQAIGPTCSLVLLSAPDALDYYPKVGFKKADHAFFIQRET